MNLDLPPFIPGLKLSEYFYFEAVKPIIAEHFSDLAYSAGRLDYGSDILGFDTPQSRDHGWGPKLTIFLSPGDYDPFQGQISEAMANHLPSEICGYPTNFDCPFTGEGTMQAIENGPVQHWVVVTTMAKFFTGYLGVDPSTPLSEVDWLTIPQNHLRTIASGKIFHDGLNQLQFVKDYLHWYPKDIWFYLLANQWRRIDQEEPFMARCGDVGDEIGSQIVATRQVNEIIKLCFLMEQQYAPYYKWFGTAFSKLKCAVALAPVFHQIFTSPNWQTREKFLSQAYLILMEMHNSLNITPQIDPEISSFYNRPYQVPHVARFVDALHKAIRSETVRNLPQHIGSVEQFVDSTDILSVPEACQKLRSMYP